MENESRSCYDCGVEPGELHADGCDIARCLATGGQRLSCYGRHEPPLPGTNPCGQDRWSGMWPGVAECRELGWFCVMEPGKGWVSVPEGTPGAMEDLNRLAVEAVWDRARGRFGRRD